MRGKERKGELEKRKGVKVKVRERGREKDRGR